MKGLTKLVKTPVDDVPEKLDAVRQARREYERGLGALADDAHARVDALVASARETFEGMIDNGSIPDQPRAEAGWVLAVSHVLSSPDFACRAHDEIDKAAKAGRFNSTPRSEVEAKIAAFDRERRVLELATREAVVEQAEAEVAAAREVFGRARQEAGG